MLMVTLANLADPTHPINNVVGGAQEGRRSPYESLNVVVVDGPTKNRLTDQQIGAQVLGNSFTANTSNWSAAGGVVTRNTNRLVLTNDVTGELTRARIELDDYGDATAADMNRLWVSYRFPHVDDKVHITVVGDDTGTVYVDHRDNAVAAGINTDTVLDVMVSLEKAIDEAVILTVSTDDARTIGRAVQLNQYLWTPYVRPIAQNLPVWSSTGVGQPWTKDGTIYQVISNSAKPPVDSTIVYVVGAGLD